MSVATTDTGTTEPVTTGAEGETTTPTGTEGKKGLEDLLSTLDDADRDAVLATVAKARKEAADYRTKLRTAEPLAKQAQTLLDAQKSAEDLANEKAVLADVRAQGFRDRAVQAEVKALAATKFADPEDASAFLQLGDYVDLDGDINTTAIQTDLDDLLQRKPHLARLDSKGGRPLPDKSQGSGGNNSASTKPEDIFGDWIHAQLPQ
jgi:hypothetical protein